MRNISLKLVLLYYLSCNENKIRSTNFHDRILDIIIENSNGEIVEFPELYDSLTNKIADDKAEKLKFVEKLKPRGFKIVDRGRGNHILGPRSVVINLKKKDCECEVAKTYYSTSVDSLYRISEKISCKKASR